MPNDLRLWVVDTSSLAQIRRAGISRTKQSAIFTKLTELARAGLAVFPEQVRAELERGVGDPNDPALAWVHRVRADAERTANLDTVRGVLARVPLLTDADSMRDPADPYVVALAIDSEALGGVSILSEDRSDRNDGRGNLTKVSIATAAGLWDIPVVPLAGFMLRYVDESQQ